MLPRSGTGETAWSQFKEALRSNDNFEYVYWLKVGLVCIFDWFIRILGPALVVFAVVLIGLTAYMFMVFILPAAIPNVPFRILNFAWSVFCLTNIYFNYLLCVFTKPGTTEDASQLEDKLTLGRPEELFHDDVEESTEPMLQLEGRRNGTVTGRSVQQQQKLGVENRRSCSRYCQDVKPVRAHHCHICDCCILNMDHHCPWVNNCVGYFNLRYFLLFLVYIWAGCMYAALVTLPQFIKSCKGRSLVSSLSVHIRLDGPSQTAITTIEFYNNQTNRINARNRGEVFSNPFNLGWRKNWAQVFGDGPIILTLIATPSLRKPPPPIVSFFEGAKQHPNQDLIDLPQDPAFLV